MRIHRCDDCGTECPLSPESRYEFTWSCGCGNSGVVSDSREQPPPRTDAPTAQALLRSWIAEDRQHQGAQMKQTAAQKVLDQLEREINERYQLRDLLIKASQAPDVAEKTTRGRKKRKGLPNGAAEVEK